MRYRQESDSMGAVQVPENAHYGAQTQRAMENFAISGEPMPLALVRALARIKRSAARVNVELEVLDVRLAKAIETAAGEVADGKHDDQLLVDVFQTGSGTSSNMNVNEVIAGRANEILTGTPGGRSPVHPNDHVNAGQSSNDTVPTALHVAAAVAVTDRLIPALSGLRAALADRTEAFSDVKKIGRTHLQDAVPMTLGDEFSGYARQVELGISRVTAAAAGLEELALGGTAVGTGLNARPGFAERVIRILADETGIGFREAVNHFEAQAARDAAVCLSGALKTVAVSLTKIANDLRWLASGPRCGIGEIDLPPLQPGSSIMPGKVNPVIPEVVLQVAAQVVGNDAAIAFAGGSGNFELNVAIPVIARNLLGSIDLLTSAAAALADKCVWGITANRERCAMMIDRSLSLAAHLIPEIGYDRAADLAKTAHQTGISVRRAAEESGLLTPEALDRLLSM